MTAFEEQAIRQPAQATGRKRLIIRFHPEICLMCATVRALKDGYNALYVTDAVGGRSQTARTTGIERLGDAGTVPTTALAWSTSCSGTGLGRSPHQARGDIYWYFNEVPKLSDEVGVAEAAKPAASAQEGH
jgi:hypothetical protein